MKLHFLGFLIGSSALSAVLRGGDGIPLDIHANVPVERISTLAIPNFKIDYQTADTLIRRTIDPIDLIVAQANPTFVSKGKIFIQT